MKQLNLFLLIIFLFIFSSCGTIKEGFTNPKKKSTDEFLVEKKSPLIMPPEFNELPMPDQSNDIKKEKNSNIENLLKEF